MDHNSERSTRYDKLFTTHDNYLAFLSISHRRVPLTELKIIIEKHRKSAS